MKFRALLPVALLLGGFFAQSAKADDLPTIYDVTDSITTSSSTQLGRLSRNSVPQDWNGQEAYPNTVNPTVTYYYNTYAISNSLFNPNNYLLINLVDQLGNGLLFASAYENSYDPTNKQQNWLGDLGYNSVAYGPYDSLFFEILMPPGADLVLVVNTTGGGTSGTNNPYELVVNAYSDTEYDNVALSPYVAPTPEPSTFVELGTGLLALAGVARRRFLNA